MNLAIVHYHLNRGGVTQVILNHLQSIDLLAGRGGAPQRVALLYDGQRAGWPSDALSRFTNVEVSLHELPELGYDSKAQTRPAELADRLRARLGALRFTADTTILHAHNHALGKNASLPGALAMLAQDGYWLLLQVHDFAEDFRPRAYAAMSAALGADSRKEQTTAYPQARQIHYAVLNGRDRTILAEAGLDASRIHLLANPVAEFNSLPSQAAAKEKLAACGIPADRPLIVYPVRAIRRKNIGEAVLWAALAQQRATVGITLAPLNADELPSYNRWKQLAKELKLPCVFEAGAAPDVGFFDILAASDLLLTTSVAEGFGMVFLEAWLAGRMLAGRDLPEITADFKQQGVNLESLYARLDIPTDWIGRDEIRGSLGEAYSAALAAYGRSKIAQDEIDALAAGDTIDFAFLNGGQQRRVVQRAASDADCRRTLLQLNERLAAALAAPAHVESPTIVNNADAVRAAFNPRVCGERLAIIYQQLAASACETEIQALWRPERILDSFLRPSRFHPIRVEA